MSVRTNLEAVANGVMNFLWIIFFYLSLWTLRDIDNCTMMYLYRFW
jgi:hypothetical protein